MRTLAAVMRRAAIAGGISLMVTPYLLAQEKVSNVVIEKDRIVLPGTRLSTPDRDEMNKILKHYDKSLYKIETYRDGQLKKTVGALSEVVTNRQLASEIADRVKMKGFSQYAVQVTGKNEGVAPGASPTGGTGSHPTNAPPPPPTPVGPSASPTGGTGTHPTQATTATTGPSTHGLHEQNESDQLLERLRPILEKYSKK